MYYFGFLYDLDVVFVEKILRVQPNVKKIFLLMRATAKRTVEQRLHEEVYIYMEVINLIALFIYI